MNPPTHILWSDTKGHFMSINPYLPVVDPFQVIAEAVTGTKPPNYIPTPAERDFLSHAWWGEKRPL